MSERVITLPAFVDRALAELATFCGKQLEIPVQVNWFPSLTDAQQWENAQARLAGDVPPHADPNLITVIIPLSGPRP